MRRLVFSVIVASGLLMAVPSSAFADDPAPVVSAPSTPGKKLCKVTDERLNELSGIVATKTGFVVINDGGNQADLRKVFFLNTKCKVVKEQSYSGKGPLDTEDMILSPDGTKVWIADIGDNNYDDAQKRRGRIALWTMPVDGSAKPQLHRVAYPQGDFHDAEAMLLNGDGTPLIVTKEVGKPTYVYQPTGPLQTNNETPVPLKRVAEIKLSGTTTAGPPVARIGNKTVSGGAIAPGGGKVVLRTYTDALEWDVKNGDVLAALKGKPRTTGLPNEPLGEAITYSSDGKTFYTVSDMNGISEAANYIQSYTPATTVASATKSTAESDGKKWYSDLSITDVTLAVGGIGILGLILVGVGVFGIVQHRKRVRGLPAASDDFESPLADDPETELIGVGGAAQPAGVYGGGRPGPAGGPVYGAGGATGGGGQRGPVYGSQGRGSGAQQGGRNAVYGAQPGQPATGRGPQGQPPRGPQGQPPRGPQGQPPRGPQGQPARNPQGQPQGQPQRNPQGQPPRGPQGQPPRNPQGQPPRGPQGQPQRNPQGQPPRGPQGQPPRNPQGQPPRGPQAQPPRNPQGQPPRGPQGQPPRGPQGQPPRGSQGQPPRGAQGQPPRGAQGQPPRGAQGQPPRGSQSQPARSQPDQSPRGGGQRPSGVYGQQSPARPQRGDGYADYSGRPESRFDNPGYGRR